MDYYVYAHVKPDNTVFYIGKGTGKRAWSTRNRNAYWQHTVAKYGYNVLLLADGLTQEQALEEEAAIIAHFKPFGTLVNILDRGDIAPSSHPDVARAIGEKIKGIKRSEATKAKLRAIVRTDAWRAKMSAAAKNKVVSAETRAKLSAAGRNRVVSEATRVKISKNASAWQTGRTLSEEHRANISKNSAFKGKKRPEHAALMREKSIFSGANNPNYGRGDQQRGALNPAAVAIVGTHQIHGEKQWPTLKAAAEELGVSLAAVSQALRKQGRSKGWAFRKAA